MSNTLTGKVAFVTAAGDGIGRAIAIAFAQNGANGDVLDILVQSRGNAKAARRFFKRLVALFGKPRAFITDKLRSYKLHGS